MTSSVEVALGYRLARGGFFSHLPKTSTGNFSKGDSPGANVLGVSTVIAGLMGSQSIPVNSEMPVLGAV